MVDVLIDVDEVEVLVTVVEDVLFMLEEEVELPESVAEPVPTLETENVMAVKVGLESVVAPDAIEMDCDDDCPCTARRSSEIKSTKKGDNISTNVFMTTTAT